MSRLLRAVGDNAWGAGLNPGLPARVLGMLTLLTAALLLSYPQTGLAQGRHGKVDAAVHAKAGATSNAPMPVIVTPRAGATAMVEAKLDKRGRKARKRLSGGQAIAVWLDPRDIDDLAADANVAGLSYDAPIISTGAPPGNRAAKDKNDDSTLRHAVAASSGDTGKGVGVAIIDSGIAKMPGLAERISAFYDFTGGGAVERPPIDPYGHGTHVAGIVGGAFGDGAGGVATEVHLVGLRVLDNHGAGVTSTVIDAVDFAVANRTALGIDIINLSLGHPIYEPAATDPLVRAVERAVRAGIVVVTSAGNMGVNPDTGLSGYGGILSPGNAPSAITVGAADTAGTIERADDRVEDFSSRGPTWFDGGAKPDLVAPGVGIVSASAPNSTLDGNTRLSVKFGRKKYLRMSGTSMAAPVVSGVAALVLQVSRDECASLGRASCPGLAPAAVKAVLQYTATPLADGRGVAYDTLTQGSGEVNAAGAVAVARAVDTSMAVGQPWLRWPLDPSSTFDTERRAWSQSIVWGNRTLSGEILTVRGQAWDDSIVWGTWFGDDSIVWGTAFGDLDSIVWGTNLVWGPGSIAWGTSIVWGTDITLTIGGQSIVWGTADWDSIVWGTMDWDSIVWGTMDWDSIVWGTMDWDSIVWGTALTDGSDGPEVAGHGKSKR